MRLGEARKILHISNGYTEQTVRDAFFIRLHEQHPDCGGGGGDIDRLKQARDVMLEKLGVKTPCPQCKGRGTVSLRFGVIDCTRCEGTGVV